MVFLFMLNGGLGMVFWLYLNDIISWGVYWVSVIICWVYCVFKVFGSVIKVVLL